MLTYISLENIICIDIETVPEHDSIHGLDAEMKELYLHKSLRLKEENETEEEQYTNHAAIYAEFGKIICISVGIFNNKRDEPLEFRIKSFAGDDEKEILQSLAEMLNKYYGEEQKFYFAGHNIKEFDIPYICRRMLVNRIPLPVSLDLSGKKPYEVNHIDTMQLWRFGDYKHYTSIKLLAKVLGIPSPKDDISGKDVGKVYWMEKNLPRIVNYCRKDVLTVAQLLLRYKNMDLLKEEQVKAV
jgi:3'-5' exonuclease